MATVAPLEWDTTFWGRSSARVWPEPGDTPASLTDALATAQATQQFVQLLLPVSAVDLIQAAEAAGFRYVDVRCLFDMTTPPNGPSGALDHVTSADPTTVSEAAQLAATAHTISRFSSDPALDPERAAELYRLWVRRDAAAPGWHLAVVRLHGAVCGYVTFGLDDTGVGAIGLIGVSEHGRGRGIGRALAIHATETCFRIGARRMTVVTQAGNAPAMALYRTVGFGVAELGCWLHWHAPMR